MSDDTIPIETFHRLMDLSKKTGVPLKVLLLEAIDLYLRTRRTDPPFV